MRATSVGALLWVLAATGCMGAPGALAQGLPSTPPRHVVVVVMENHAAAQILKSPSAPYINRLAKEGASFTQSFGVTHPSQPNYLALFSGSTHGLTDDACVVTLSGPNLARSLIDAGKRFVGYSEGLPSVGFDGCNLPQVGYWRKHAPWVNFTDLPASTNQPFSAFPADFEQLPTVAFVIPNQKNDMHDGTIAQGDAWLRKNLSTYVKWAKSNNGLLILTWDEDDEDRHHNRIATIFHGPMVKPGPSTQRIDHYNVLRTIEELYQLPHAANAASAAVIGNIWKPVGPN